jgi:cell division transport system permease protein
MRSEGAIARMNFRHLEFLLQETLTGIRRNALMSLAAISTIAVSLFLLGSLRLAIVNLDEMARTLCGRFEMRVFLEMHLASDKRDELGKRIAAMPGVKECQLVRKEDAWPELCHRLQGTVEMSDLGNVNPLPDAFTVHVEDLEQMGALADRIRVLPGVDEVTDTRVAAERMAAIVRAIRLGGAIAVAILAVVATVIVSNTIRLTVYARRREISIMQLVGATNACVRTPFLLEGAFHGMAGALGALLLLAAGYSYLYREVRGAVPFLELLPPSAELFWAQGPALIGAGVGLGLFASLLSVRRYLHG